MTLLFQISGVFPNLTENLQNMGFFLYLFPFLLALAIFYGMLSWALGEKVPKSAVSLISVMLAFFVMLYSSWNVGIVSFFANLTGTGLIFGSGILLIAVLFGLMGFSISDLTGKAAGREKWIFIIGVLLIGILIFFGAGGASFGLIPDWSDNGEFLSVIFVIAAIALAVWWLGNEGGAKPAAG